MFCTARYDYRRQTLGSIVKCEKNRRAHLCVFNLGPSAAKMKQQMYLSFLWSAVFKFETKTEHQDRVWERAVWPNFVLLDKTEIFATYRKGGR